MSENTKNITLKGLFWNALDRFGNQAIVTIVLIITGRILLPEDFGIVGMLAIFSVIATSFVDSGLATSLVRTKVVDEKDYSSMFVFNLAISSILYLILFFAAPYIEAYNGVPGLALYARVLFLQIIVHSFGIVQYVKILKNFQFNITARINLLSIFFSSIIVITLALLGFGVWALILQPLLYTVFRTVMLWIWGDWKLNLTYSTASLKTHFSFSLSYMVSNMIGKILSPFYSSFIGKHFGTMEAGYYYNGNKWGETPGQMITAIIQGTTLSTLTPIQDDLPRFLNACRKSMSSLAFILVPVSFLAICVAKPAFVVVLTEKWLPSVVLFQLLCFAGLFTSFTDLNANFLSIKGRSKYFLSLEIIKISLAFIILFFTYKQGLVAIASGLIIVRIICYIIASIMSAKVYGYNLLLQTKDLAPSFIISAIAASVAYLPLYFNLISQYTLLVIIQSLIFVIIYIGANHLLKNEIWLEVLGLIKKKLIKKH
ncbi:lipopolysaccharide biosynthesis protein [Sphingobacterium endophyticum]|uniref:lipopolysaccharide biosynthesis protein n=1 Tax=Sphingobacterium endophyticum TaxID=2546448 RepID=UPI0012E10A7F|nr:lipopolysaccharide biosynthesis protein [Sphingobacterium endophyticum]